MSVADFLKRTADRNGLARERFEERQIPTDHESLTVMPFFGDYRGLFLLSSWLLHRYRRERKGSKYFILVSWPGFGGLFPFVSEYWSVQDESQFKRFYEHADGFRNRSDLATIYARNLNEFFRDVVDWRQVCEPYHHNGITQKFWDDYGTVQRFLPPVSSAAVIGRELSKEIATRPGYKVFLQPSLFTNNWRTGRTHPTPTPKEFWVGLANRLLDDGMTPVLWQNQFSYDLSGNLLDRCLYVADRDVSKVLAAMRATGCVLDVHNGTSRLAIAARTPFLALDERSRYVGVRDFEVDDLCAKNLPKRYIFTFSTIISHGNHSAWSACHQSVSDRLAAFLPELNRDDWPSTAESVETVLYENVRRNKAKKIGTRFLKVNKE